MQKNFFFILQIDPPILETVNADSSDQEMSVVETGIADQGMNEEKKVCTLKYKNFL